MKIRLYNPKLSLDSARSKIFSNTLGAKPLFYVVPSPIIVKVFPVPVGPYAKIQTLNPSITLVISPCNSSNIFS